MSFRGNTQLVFYTVILTIVVCVISVVWLVYGLNSESVIRRGDLLTKVAHDSYAQGSLESAALALKAQIDHWELHQQQISQVMRIDVTMQVAYARYANLLIHMQRVAEAKPFLEKAYVHHNQVLKNASAPPMTREEFIPYFFDWMNQLDRQTGARWKRGIDLHTNTVDSVRALFVEDK